CFATKLSGMPDVEIATRLTDGVRFIVDIVAAKDSFASLVVAETFPTEQYRLRIKEDEASDALLTGIRSYTLLRLHELVPGRSRQALCASIANEIGDKVLSKEYTERNDWYVKTIIGEGVQPCSMRNRCSTASSAGRPHNKLRRRRKAPGRV